MSGKILIVEDDSIFRNYLFTVLKSQYEVTIAANPVEAFEYLNREIFDLIVSDLRMPEMDGREFVEKVHAEISPGLPVIIVTAFEDDWPVEEGMLSHAYTFLRKGGFLPSELKDIVEKAIGKPPEPEASMLPLNEIQFREIFDSLADIVIVTDSGLKPVYANRRFGIITGLGIKDMSGSLLNILSRESGNRLKAEIAGMVDSRQFEIKVEISAIEGMHSEYDLSARKIRTSETGLFLFTGKPSKAIDAGDVAGERISLVQDDCDRLKRDNDGLRKSFDRIAADARGIIIWMDSSYNCVYVNPDVERILGYKPGEFIGSRIAWERILHSEDAHIISDIVTSAEKGIRGMNGEARLFSKSGLLVYISWQAMLSYDAEGLLDRIDILGEDITQKAVAKDELVRAGKRLEEVRRTMLSSPEERCRLIVEGSSNIIFTLNSDSQIVYINPKGLNELGVSEYEIIGRPFQEFISDAISSSRFDTAIWKMNEGSDPGFINVSVDTRQGRNVWGINMWAMSSSQGKIEYAGVARDVTSDVSNFKKLRLLANIEQYSTDAIIGLDLERRVISWNHGAYMMFGWTEEEITGNYSFTLLVPEEWKRGADEMFSEVIEKGYVRDLETKRKTRSGEMLDVSISITALRDETGKTFGFSEIIRDITEQKRMEAALIQSERLAAMGKLSASIAHEINNPLYGIKNCLNHVLTAEESTKIDAQFVRLAVKETDRIAELIRNMKTFYQPSEGEVYAADINEIIREVLTFNRKYLEENKVRLELALENCPDVLVVPEQMKQVFLNLMTNAAEAMPKGGSLKVITSPGEDNKTVNIIFEDTGVGIAKEDIPKIFDMFYSKKPHVKGVGLGLSVSYGIIKRHGGKINVESEPGSGTIFRITLPVKPGWERQLKLDLK